ncbi:MAG: DinB family protein [Acidobacteriia bacterium]|nr:DinB family protein [Terriglobia bacterium]
MPALPTIQDNLRRSFEGDAWHGPAMMEILKGVSAKQAAARPIPNAHSIWELVLHVTTWQSVVVRRLKGEAYDPSPAQDYPPISDKSAAAWEHDLATLRHVHAELNAAVDRLPESRLTEIVPGAKYTIEFMLQGVIQHDLYHAGQMAILKKALQNQ